MFISCSCIYFLISGSLVSVHLLLSSFRPIYYISHHILSLTSSLFLYFYNFYCYFFYIIITLSFFNFLSNSPSNLLSFRNFYAFGFLISIKFLSPFSSSSTFFGTLIIFRGPNFYLKDFNKVIMSRAKVLIKSLVFGGEMV